MEGYVPILKAIQKGSYRRLSLLPNACIFSLKAKVRLSSIRSVITAGLPSLGKADMPASVHSARYVPAVL